MISSLLREFIVGKTKFYVARFSQFSKGYSFIFPPTRSDSFLKRFLNFTGAESIFINLSRLKFLCEGISCAKLHGSGLPLKLADRRRKRGDTSLPLDRIFLILCPDLMFGFIKLHV